MATVTPPQSQLTPEQRLEEQALVYKAELVETDGEPLETPWHRAAINLLIDVVSCFFKGNGLKKLGKMPKRNDGRLKKLGRMPKRNGSVPKPSPQSLLVSVLCWPKKASPHQATNNSLFRPGFSCQSRDHS